MSKSKLKLNDGTLSLGGVLNMDTMEVGSGKLTSPKRKNWTDPETVTTLGGQEVSAVDRFKIKLMRLWLPKQWRMDYIPPRPLTTEEIVKRELKDFEEDLLEKVEDLIEAHLSVRPVKSRTRK